MEALSHYTLPTKVLFFVRQACGLSYPCLDRLLIHKLSIVQSVVFCAFQDYDGESKIDLVIMCMVGSGSSLTRRVGFQLTLLSLLARILTNTSSPIQGPDRVTIGKSTHAGETLYVKPPLV